MKRARQAPVEINPFAFTFIFFLKNGKPDDASAISRHILAFDSRDDFEKNIDQTKLNHRPVLPHFIIPNWERERDKKHNNNNSIYDALNIIAIVHSCQWHCLGNCATFFTIFPPVFPLCSALFLAIATKEKKSIIFTLFTE